MKKQITMFMLVVILALLTVSLASASEGEPLGGCPDDFHLHALADMHHHHGHGGEHHHVGNDRDRNGDGYICGKHVSADGGVHVHIDNNIPRR